MSPTEARLLVDRIRLEFIEMPGLRLTMAQVRRLWGLEGRACEHLVDLLVESRFLVRSPGGTIYRAS